MNHTIPEESVIVDGEVYARHVAINQNYYHPTGEFIPLSAEDKQQTLLHRWSRILRRFPMSAALEEGDRRVSYAAFNALANRIAHAILARRVPKDLPIAALFEVEGDLQIGLFAIWKAGNFFVWLEPEQPLAHNQSIVEDSGALVVVTNQKHAALAHQLWPGEDQVIVIEELPTNLPLLDPPITIDASSPAYLMYSSGSTGRPKGTIELHRNLVAMLAVHESIFHFSTHDRVAYMVHDGGWSLSAAAALMYGGTSLAFDLRKEGLGRLPRWLNDSRVTILLGGAVVSSFLSSLDGSEEFPSLRVILGGDQPMYVEHLLAFQQSMPDTCLMGNIYSATECCSITILVMDKDSRFEGRILPVGFPTLHAEVEIWNDGDTPVPVGETGEVIVITPYAAEGYWKSPQLTASSFGVDWQDRRYFRTGDLGRIDEQGYLWLLGRKDDQFKISIEEAFVEEPVVDPEVAGSVDIIAGSETSESVQAPTSLGSVDDLDLLSTLVIAQTLDLQEIPEVEEIPAEVEAPALAANQESSESLALDEPLETQESNEAVETPERSVLSETTNTLIALAALKALGDDDGTEIPESTASVELDESVEAPAKVELTEIPDASELPEAVEKLETGEPLELQAKLEPDEILEVEAEASPETAETRELHESVDAPESLDLTEVSEPIELLGVTASADLPENPDLTEIPQSSETPVVAAGLVTLASVELSEIPDETEIPETAESHAPEIVDESVVTPLALGLTEIPQTTENPIAAEGLAALAILAMADTPEDAETLEAPETVDMTDTVEVVESPESSRALDISSALEADEILEDEAVEAPASDMLEEVAAPWTLETSETPDATIDAETMEVSELAQSPETTPSLEDGGIFDDPESLDVAAIAALTLIPEVTEFPEMGDESASTESVDKNEISEVEETPVASEMLDVGEKPEATEIPELSAMPEAIDTAEMPVNPDMPENRETPELLGLAVILGLSAIPEDVETPVTTEPVEAPVTLELSEIPETTELLEVAETPNVVDIGDATELPGVAAALAMAEAIQGDEKPELSEFPEATEIPEVAESHHDAEGLDVADIAKAIITLEMLQAISPQETPDVSVVSSTAEIPERVESNEESTISAEVETVEAIDTPAIIAPVVEKPIVPLFVATKAYEQIVKLGEQHQAYFTGAYVPMNSGEMQLTLLHRWEHIVERFGNNVALEEPGRTLTYSEFNVRANRIAHAILSRNVSKDQPVALLADVEGDLPIGMIAIWKAGNFYLWLEPDQPLARNHSIVEDSGATVVVTNRNYETMARQLWPNEDAVIVVEDLAGQPPFNPPITIDGESPAYLMYTSGSTGKPEGVLDLHRNFVHMLAVRQDIFRYTTDERFALIARGSAVLPVVGAALMYGSSLLPFNPMTEGIPRFNQWLIERRITTLIDGPFLRTWLLSLDGRQQFPNLRRVMGGGGPTRREHVEAYQRFLPATCILSSTYSATEVRSVSIMLADKSTRVETRLLPAGILSPPVTVEIWDERDRSVPVDENGEIVVFTPFAAQGYWNSPELTASRFGVDAQGRRYYRTGDLGQLDKHGQLWVLGRVDGQVKIRGYRVEPAEIEVALLELPDVKEAAVIPIGENDESRKLVAYVGSTAKIGGPDLRKRLERLMPAFMVPATIVVLDKLPRNDTGKVDRALLLAMQGEPVLPRSLVTEQPATPSQADIQTEAIQTAVTLLAAAKILAPTIEMVLPDESVIVNGETFVQHVKLGQQNYHPTGEHVPITPAEQEKTLLHRFGRMVERFDSNPAIEEGKRVLSYIEFNALTNRIAHALIARKLSPAQPVAVLCDIETDLYIGTFAVWKAGLFFVWMKPQQPLALNKSIVEASGATVVITNRKYADLARQLFSDPTGVFVAEEMTSGYASYDPDIALQPSSPAYLTYTIDGTGKLKGVLEVHRNLMEQFVVRQSFLHFSNEDRVVHLSSASGWALGPYAALMYGGCLLPYQAKDESLARFSQWLVDRRITMATGGDILRPWLLSLEGSQQFPNLRLVSLDAGASYQQQMQAYQRNLSDRCLLLISYGATGCQTATLLVLDKSSQIPSRLLPAGFPTVHVAIEIWNDLKRALPVGEIGEVVVFSPFAAQGYGNSPEITESQFGVDAKGRRYYQMGDLGRLDENGALWVLGRKDGQVQIHGNRVDLAEVEVALMDVPNVKEAAVIPSGTNDETQVLTAFATMSTPATGNEVRQEVETRLPSHMVPATVIILEEFPRSANGQIDRSMLQEVAAGRGRIPTKKPSQAKAPALPTKRESSLNQVSERQKPAPLSLPGHYQIAFRINATQVMPGVPGNRPIFFSPGGDGSLRVVQRHQKLFGSLGNQRPLYGLVAADSDEASGLYKNIDELVAASLFAMRRIQPRGPYTLIGESLGGKLAFEMARALEKEGERVALLALLDAPFRGSGMQGGPGDSNWLRQLFKGFPRKSDRQEAQLAAYGLQSKKNSVYLAQQRYMEILKKFEPSKSYSLPTLAIFTRQYEHHRPRWEKVLPAIRVIIVEGVHDDYLRVSGEKVAGLLRQAMEGTPAPQRKALKFR